MQMWHFMKDKLTIFVIKVSRRGFQNEQELFFIEDIDKKSTNWVYFNIFPVKYSSLMIVSLEFLGYDDKSWKH